MFKNCIIITICTFLWYCVSDCVRTYAIIVSILFIGLNSVISSPKILLSKSPNLPDRFTIQFCKYISLVHKLLQEAVEIYINTTLSSIFWALSILIGVLVKKFDEIPVTVFVMLLCIAVLICLAITVSLHVVSSITQNWEQVIQMCRTTCWLGYAKIWNLDLRKLRKIFWLEAKALKPIEIRYKPFTTISRSFMMHYLQSVRDRVFDMILIF